ncbi:MAG: hypothetical protein LBK94_11425 [Prevotellaceae bacterium]|jgi:hypothetical protein|nr:hypothetical protein [Prevotellaceae bacterium]
MKSIKRKIAAWVCGLMLLCGVASTASAMGVLYCYIYCNGYIDCVDYGKAISLKTYFAIQDAIDASC